MAISNWVTAVAIAKVHKVNGRIKVIGENLPEQWEVLFIPSNSYIETGSRGPVSLQQVEWLDIQSSVVESKGRLVPNKVHDKSIEIVSSLKSAGLTFTTKDGFIRVLPPNKSLKDAP